AFIAPVAAQNARTTAKASANADPDLLRAASFFASSMMSITLLGATEPTKCSSELKGPGPNRPSRPITRIAVGRKASSALKAICLASPTQSSAMKCFPAALKTSTQPRGPRCAGLPVREWFLVVPVDKGERAELRLRCPFPAPASHQPHRRADPAGEHEAGSERADRHRGELRPQPRPDVRDLLEAAAEILDGVGELVALGLDVAANLLFGAAVTGCHRSSRPRSSASPRRSPARGGAASPSGPSGFRRRPASRRARRGSPS